MVAALAWCGVLLQLYLSLRLAADSGKSPVGGLVAFFGYFTVLTNIFVALTTTLPLTFRSSRSGRWFGSAMTLGCATTAIVFVGVVYHLLLRNLWAPAGLQWLADVILHYAVPITLLVYWIMFPPTQKLPRWRRWHGASIRSSISPTRSLAASCSARIPTISSMSRAWVTRRSYSTHWVCWRYLACWVARFMELPGCRHVLRPPRRRRGDPQRHSPASHQGKRIAARYSVRNRASPPNCGPTSDFTM